MLNSKQYRVKVAEYEERGKKTDAPNEIREFKNLGRTFTEMADIFGRSDNAVIRLRVLRVSQAPGSSMSACHGKHRAVDLLARSRVVEHNDIRQALTLPDEGAASDLQKLQAVQTHYPDAELLDVELAPDPYAA